MTKITFLSANQRSSTTNRGPQEAQTNTLAHSLDISKAVIGYFGIVSCSPAKLYHSRGNLRDVHNPKDDIYERYLLPLFLLTILYIFTLSFHSLARQQNMTHINTIKVFLFMVVISLAFAKHRVKPNTSDSSNTKLAVTSTVCNTVGDHSDTNSK